MPSTMPEFLDIWEVESHFKCPILGAMLSEEKHRSILEKCGYNVSPLKPYEYHSKIMLKLYDKNPVSVKVNNFIRSNAAKSMKQVRNANPSELRNLWEANLKTGNVGPMMYAIISYEDTPIDLLCDVHGEVHMLAHANMTGIIEVRKQLTKSCDALEKEKIKNEEKAARIKEIVQERKADAIKIQQIEQENQRLKSQLKLMASRIDPATSFEENNQQQAMKIQELEHLLEKKNRELQIREREKRAMEIELFSVKNENELIHDQMQALLNGFASFGTPQCMSDPDCLKEKCSRYRLCARRIFMIGGHTKMKPYYQEIVEKAGGVFDYHDGYMKNACNNLEAMVRRSDLVLCPVNCNSHNACLRVKKLCHRHNKELKILNNSSLSAISQAIFITEEQPVV